MVTGSDTTTRNEAGPRREAALRVVGEALADARRGGGGGAGAGSDHAMGQAIDSPTDPRWVLAIRTAEALEGAILRPERREQLVRTGKVMGLSAFDCNLVIAIVQDQARRGYEPQYCPTAGEPQLRLVPLPRRARFMRRQRAYIAITVAGIIAMEVAMLLWLLK